MHTLGKIKDLVNDIDKYISNIRSSKYNWYE